MKFLAALAVIVLLCLTAQSGTAKSNRYIDALASAPTLVAYSDDGAADVTVTENAVPAVRAIVNLGAKAIPLLIAHLDDTRPTSATFGRRNPQPVSVGHICLDILTNIIKARRILVGDCVDDGLGACIREGYYFRPDAYARKGSRSIARAEISRVKRNWQQAYRRGEIRYQYPEWWKRRI